MTDSRNGTAADVVLVAMGEDQTSYMLAILLEVSEIGRYDVDAQQFRVPGTSSRHR